MLAHALEGTEGIPIHHLSYDIMCQYRVHLKDWFEKSFPQKADQVDKLKKEIGKTHLINHKDDCQWKYSYNYKNGTGHTDGEAIERFWAEFNLCASVTKQQNSGHQHDTLDNTTGYSNWMKDIGMGVCDHDFLCLN